MKISLALKTLLRTPLKTLMTFLLIAATSYMLFFSVAEYAVTSREFERAASFYKGTGAVEVEKLQLNAPSRSWGGSQTASGSDVFLYTDPRVENNYYEDKIDRYEYKGLTQAEVDAILELPYISGTSTRYMTAGLSPDLTRRDDMTEYYVYNSRFIAEVTFETTYEDPYVASMNAQYQVYHHRVFATEWSGFKLLAGDPEWFRSSVYGDDSIVRIGAYDLNPGDPDGSSVSISRRSSMDGRDYSVLHYGKSNFNEVYSYEFLESLVPGERYLIIGRLDPQERFSRVTIMPTINRYTLSDSTTTGVWPQVMPLKDLPENYLELEEFAPLRELIEITNNDLHTVDVVYTGDMSDILRYSEGNATMAYGRMLTDEDSANKNNVCVMSHYFMFKNGLQIGDTISLKLGDKLFEQNAALGAVAVVPERYPDNFTEEIEFEIVGSYMDVDSRTRQAKNPHWNYSDNTIFVPSSFLPVEVPADHIVKPGEFSIIVDSQNINAFLEETRPIIENELGLNLYFSDGGWLAVEKQINQADDLAMVRLVLFSLSVLIAIGLTVYLFIMRKRKEYAIMRALGTPRRIADRGLFVPLGVVAVLALIVGNVLAYSFADSAVRGSLEAYTQLGIDTDTSVPTLVVGISVAGELAALLIVTAFGLHRVGKRPPLELLQAGTNRSIGGFAASMSGAAFIQYRSMPVSERPVQPVIQNSLHASIRGSVRHVLWYTSRHIRRTKAKVLLAVGLALLLFGTIGQFTVIRGIYRDVYENMDVKPYFIDGLCLGPAEKLAGSGMAKEPYYENVISILECNLAPATVVVTNNIAHYGERNSDVAVEIELLSGYDLGMFNRISAKMNQICALDAELMESLGIGLGDTVRLSKSGLWQMLSDEIVTAEAGTEKWENQQDRVGVVFDRYSVPYTVVGRIVSGGSPGTVFIPVGDELKIVYTQSVIYEDGPMECYDQIMVFDHVEYTLALPSYADEFAALAKKMVSSSIGDLGASGFAFAMDTREADNMQRTIGMLDNLYPIAVAVAAVMGGLFPGLIVMQSDREASIMRVLGTTKKRTRFMLTLEQAVLCIVGLACAVFLLLAINGWLPEAVTRTIGAYSALHFAACVMGASICAVIITQRRILELLQVKE